MANRRDSDHHNNDSSDDVNNLVLTRAKFLDFRDENQQFRDSTQQTLDQIQAALATLLNWNPNCDDEERRDNRTRGPPHRGPNRNRQQDYNEEDSEDEEYAKRESLEIIVVPRGIMAEIIRSRGTIEWR